MHYAAWAAMKAQRQADGWPGLMDTTDACRFLQVTRERLYALIKEGRIHPIRGIGKGYRFTKESLLKDVTPPAGQQAGGN